MEVTAKNAETTEMQTIPTHVFFALFAVENGSKMQRGAMPPQLRGLRRCHGARHLADWDLTVRGLVFDVRPIFEYRRKYRTTDCSPQANHFPRAQSRGKAALLSVHFVSARDDSAKASVRPDSRVAPVCDWRIAGHRPAPPSVAAEPRHVTSSIRLRPFRRLRVFPPEADGSNVH